jgi:hypothetical protein
MLIESRQDFAVELEGCEGGLALLPCPPGVPKAHRFQGGLIYTRMIEIKGQMIAPQPMVGLPVRIWLSQLETRHFSGREPPYIGDFYDRTGELPGGGLEAAIFIPKDAWSTSVLCLGMKWRRFDFTGVDGDGRRMRLVDFAFSSGAADVDS